MIAFILRQCGIDCTAILGGLVTDFGSNFVHGESDWIVVEADEFDRSFLQLTPDIAVITSMDPDHLDIYGSASEMVDAYMQFMHNVRAVVLMHDELLTSPLISSRLEETLGMLEGRDVRYVVYGEDIQKAEARVENISYGDGSAMFDFTNVNGEKWPVKLSMPGRHNINNAAAALCVGNLLGQKGSRSSVSTECCIQALSQFGGIKRRFEIIHASDKLIAIDDYAHHPKEVEAAIEAARGFYGNRRITGVFQPHLYSRTKDFYKEFAEALSELEEVVVVELYPARELPMEGVSSKLIYDLLSSQRRYMASKEELTGLLRSLDPEVLLFMGAGDLDRMIPEIVEDII
jgi:UDP-N-acetylmuramate--alanine ligase